MFRNYGSVCSVSWGVGGGAFLRNLLAYCLKNILYRYEFHGKRLTNTVATKYLNVESLLNLIAILISIHVPYWWKWDFLLCCLPLLTFLSYLSIVHTEKSECYASKFELPVTVENLFHLLHELAGWSESKFHDVSVNTYGLTWLFSCFLLRLLNLTFT